MKLVGFDDDRVGVVVDDRVVELTDLVDVPGGSWPLTAMLRLIRDYDRLRAQIEARAASGAGTLRCPRSACRPRSAGRAS